MSTFIVYHGHVGLHFKEGKFEGTLAPGKYKFWGEHKVYEVNLTPVFDTIGGQEVLTSDGGTVRVTVAVSLRLNDAKKALDAGMIEATRYGMSQGSGGRIPFQIAIREYVLSRTLEEVMAVPQGLADYIREAVTDNLAASGYELKDVFVIDLNPTGGLKAAVTDLLKVEYEGKVALARARNEAATMRSLLNTARLVREHPKLLELRILASGQKPRVTFLVGDSPSGEPMQTVLEDEQSPS